MGLQKEELSKTWIQEMRNVVEDYVRIFGEEASTVGGLSLMIDSRHTQSSLGKLFFERSISRPKVW